MCPSPRVSLGTFLRERRQDLGLSQEQLAERVGETMRQSEISRLERDHVSLPRRARLEALAAALEVSMGELLLQTGWAQAGDRLADEINAATRHFRTPEDLDAIALQDLAAIVDSIAALQDTVAAAALALEQAQDTLDSLMRALDARGFPRNPVTPCLGIVKEWETTAIFVA